MKLRMKMLMLSVVPIVGLGVIMFLMAASQIGSGIYNQAFTGMHATTLAIRDIFETGHDGEYALDSNGELWKGDSLNISQAYDIVDNIKENTGMEVTVFWGDTRILTTIVDAGGKRQIGTQASPAVVDAILKKGETYYEKGVDILGTEYTVYYIPFYQEDTEDVVGMIFLGIPRKNITKIVYRAQRNLLLVVVTIVTIAAFLVYIMVNRIVKVLAKSMSSLHEIAGENLHAEMDASVIERQDEIGDVGRGVANLRQQLSCIITEIREKSDNLRGKSDDLRVASGDVSKAMNELERTAQEMVKSCEIQAADAGNANENVSAMGRLIQSTNEDVNMLSRISEKMLDASTQAVECFEELRQIMLEVKQAISFLSEQTGLTGDSVANIAVSTNLINAIAAQTNLLSLNASIEAARAGEHGRGFAVVAQEIQQLSEQSNKAANEIQSMISTLNSNSGQTIDYMKKVEAIIEKEEEDINTTTKIFQNVKDGIMESVDGMKRVLSESEEMEGLRADTVERVENSAAISEENFASIEEIMAFAETINSRIGEIARETEVLNNLAKEMEDSIGVFSKN